MATYGGIGGIDPYVYERARAAGRVSEDSPVNHSSTFDPVLQPTLDGTTALVVAAMSWLGRSASA
jgi:hippurate hydrolase